MIFSIHQIFYNSDSGNGFKKMCYWILHDDCVNVNRECGNCVRSAHIKDYAVRTIK